jgi:xanthine dehydrogenase YagT iron-sulfur-binding subunit
VHQLAVDAVGKRVTTVEGLAQDGELTPVQRAFVEHDALMCGFCTPGFVMSVSACLDRDPGASEDEVKRACSGNLCRCGTYPHIFQAARAAGRELQGGRWWRSLKTPARRAKRRPARSGFRSRRS